MTRCPTTEQLERWLRCPHEDPEAGALAAHVDDCARCQGVLEGLTAGPSLSPAGSSAGPPTTAPGGPALGRLKDTPPARRSDPHRDPGRGPAVLAAAPAGPPLPGSESRVEQEIRRLLRSRLRVFSPLLVVVFFMLLVLFLGDPSRVFRHHGDWLGGALLAANVVTALGCAALVWTRRDLSLTTLRVIELLLFGVAAAVFARQRYTALTHGADGPWEGPGQRDMFLLQMTLINNSLWNFAIICYGVFIPNTWRRCVLVVAVLALVPVAITVLAGLEEPAVGRQLGFLLSVTALGLLVSLALAVFGSFKISTLQGEALAARQLGQYVLKERLGAGAMGEVYLAEHRLLKRPCAVKIIRPERASDPQLLRRFEREVQATALLSHYHTVEIYDYGHTDDGTFYYVMEYLPGLSLDELVARYGALPPARAVHFLRQLCGALREAHAAGMVHRDIKPSNVIACCPGGLQDIVKLVDFGLVRPPGVGAAARLTQEGLILGTPEFMSPEQARGQPALDARSDLYSLGALAYFLLTGRSPFAGKSVLETLTAHLYEPPPPPRDHAADVPADLEAVVLRCLAKDPGERYPDAEGLDRALAHCAGVGPWTEEQARGWWQAVRASATANEPAGTHPSP
jgi:serine/threonine-protein kinase